MGTQFWWFYDVLILAIAAVLFYHAVSKGFNKMVFHLVGCILAFVIGIFGSGFLAEPVYNMLFRDAITAEVQVVFEETDLYEEMASYAREQYPESEFADADREMMMQYEEGTPIYTEASAAVLEPLLVQKITPHPQRSLHDFFISEKVYFTEMLAAEADDNPAEAAAQLEKGYFRPFYVALMQMGLFLLLEIVVVIIVGIISGMAGSLEELMHIRKCNRLLAVPVALIEIFIVEISVTVAVKLIAVATNNMMLLFNQETINETMLFKFIFEKI